ncbi:MAG TPA: divergent polysaccharide deacetylase family protein [Alphaproteobacteria bacterium]
MAHFFRWRALLLAPLAFMLGLALGAVMGAGVESRDDAQTEPRPASADPPEAPRPGIAVRIPVAIPEPASIEREAPTRAVPDIADGWRRHAVAVDLPRDRKLIAIVIDDLGVDRARSDRASRLPGPLTLAFLPYARDFGAQVAAARSQGHEVIVHMPMEPLGHQDPGPEALRVDWTAARIRQHVASALDRAGVVVGLNNHMGSRFTADSVAMRPVLAELGARDLIFVDSRTTADSVAAALAREMSVPYVARDVFLDHEPTAAAVLARLAETELIARRNEHAVAIGHPRDATLDVLADWLRHAPARGLAIVPVSAIVRHKRERAMAARP